MKKNKNLINKDQVENINILYIKKIEHGEFLNVFFYIKKS